MTKFKQIQRARDTRLAKLQRGSWSVVKVNDDGRTIVVERNVTALVAERLAGSRRDSMPDDLVRGVELRCTEPEADCLFGGKTGTGGQ